MPSHSPYALSNLTFLGSRKLHKNKRVSLEIEVLPKISLFRKNLFHIWFVSLMLSLLRGLWYILIYLFPHISLIYHLFDVTLFSFQGTTFWICLCPFGLVEMRRIELLTPCLQGRCSPSWATPPFTGLRLILLCLSSFWASSLSQVPSKLNSLNSS